MRNTATSGVGATHFFRPLLQTHWFLFLLLLQIFLHRTPARISVVLNAEEARRGCKIRLTTAFTRVQMPSAHIFSRDDHCAYWVHQKRAWLMFHCSAFQPMRERERWQEISQTDNNMSENLLRVKSYLNGIRGEKNFLEWQRSGKVPSGVWSKKNKWKLILCQRLPTGRRKSVQNYQNGR